MTRKRKYILGIGLVAIVIAISLYSVNHNGNKKGSTEKEIASDATTMQSALSLEGQENEAVEGADALAEAKVAGSTVVAEDQELEANMDALVNQYFDLTGSYNVDILTSRTKADKKKGEQIFDRKKEIIEKYENVKEIIKPGQAENTYIVFATYDIKLKKVETLVPGMSVLIVTKADSGELLINNTPNDDSLTEYIKQIAAEDELKTLVEKVNKNLTAAIKKDSSLKQLVEYLNELS